MTPEAQKILNLIENVDPEDTHHKWSDEYSENKRLLAEIDARVWCWLGLSDEPFEGMKYSKVDNTYWYDHSMSDRGERECAPNYTRSLDAIKAIEPSGWFYSLCYYPEEKEAWATINKWKPVRVQLETPIFLPTEHLVRLHATIQAIDYERENA